jgi:hypothetical protein
MLSLIAITVVLAGCSKDTDCKGDRICEKSACVSPKATPDAGEWALPASRFQGQTVSAIPAPPPPPLIEAPPSAPPAAARGPLRPKGVTTEERTFPRVVRRPGQVCVQSLSDRGALQESCRPE